MKKVFLFFFLVLIFFSPVYAQQGIVGTKRITDPRTGRVVGIQQYYNSASTARTEWNKLGFRVIYTDSEIIGLFLRDMLIVQGYPASTEGRVTNHSIFIAIPIWSDNMYILFIEGEPVEVGSN